MKSETFWYGVNDKVWGSVGKVSGESGRGNKGVRGVGKCERVWEGVR